MKTIIAGSRDIENYEFVKAILDKCPWISEVTEVVTGTCRGVDKLGERWADEKGLPKKPFKPDWNLGNKGGPLRNEEMAKYADAAILIHKSGSSGTQDMKERAEKYGLKLHYVEVRPKTTFSLAQLKELEVQLEGKGMVGGDLARRLIKQQIAQITEYQKVIRDTKIMYQTLTDSINFIDHPDDRADWEMKRNIALETPTAKFLEGLVREQDAHSLQSNN